MSDFERNIVLPRFQIDANRINAKKKLPNMDQLEKWVKQGLPPIIIATHSKEVKPYQLKQVIQVLRMGGLI